MGEKSDIGLLREIDEELRQEHYAGLWSRYGSMVIAAAVVLIGSVAGYKGWQSYDLSQRTTLSQQFAAATAAADSGDLIGAQEQFSRLAHDGAAGYRVLAGFRTAALLARNGDPVGAAAAFRALTTDPDTPTHYRDLATILGAVNGLNAGESPSNIAASLVPITGHQNPWRHMAQEVAALAYLETGSHKDAADLLTGLSSDNTAPAGVRSRAQEMLLVLDESKGH